jgi:hypothetical protein
MRNGWERYLQMLKQAFNQMSPSDQEDLIEKFAMIFTVGIACLVILTFYPIVPSFYRYVAVPLVLLAAWWSGRNLAAAAIKRFGIDRIPLLLWMEWTGFTIFAIGLLIWVSASKLMHYFH